MPAALDEVIATAHKKGRQLFIQDRRTFDEQIQRLDERWTLEVTVKRLRATRSVHQNAYYWGVVIERLVQHCDHNYTPDEMHAICKAKFIPKAMALADGNGEIVFECVMGGSTRAMNTRDFEQYMAAIRQWAAETLDCDIPEPNEGL